MELQRRRFTRRTRAEFWMDVNIDILRKGERMFYDYVPTKSNIERREKERSFSWLPKKKYGFGFGNWLENVEKGKFQISSRGNVRTFTEWKNGKLHDLVIPKLLTKYTFKEYGKAYLYVFMHFQEVNVLHLLATHFSSYPITRTIPNGWNLTDVDIVIKNGNYKDIGIHNIEHAFQTNKHSFSIRHEFDEF